ncbi:15349_t:CDS:2, partial [Funneliformis mosseae]
MLGTWKMDNTAFKDQFNQPIDLFDRPLATELMTAIIFTVCERKHA